VRRLLIVLIPALAATALLATAEARNTSSAEAEAATAGVCHRTSSARRPYVKLAVSARQRAAHLRHAADIVPAPRGACPRTILTATTGGTALRVTLTGEAETPAGDPVATGEAVVRLRSGQGQLCYTLEAENLGVAAAAAHIHRGGASQAGPIVVPLRTPGADGTARGCVTVSRALVSQILANRANYYVNVHTAEFPGGAIRGQLAGTSANSVGRLISVTLNGASECNAAGTCNLGDPDGAGTTVFRFRPGQVCYRVRVQNIRLPSVGAHIHRGARTSAGGIVVQMTAPDASGVSSGCTATPQALIDEILANPANFYANVHTTDFPAGAVRGSLG
jgi:hypothetical protein